MKDLKSPCKDYSVQFNDNSHTVDLIHTIMISEGMLIKFALFDDKENFIKNIYFPITNIFKIESI